MSAIKFGERLSKFMIPKALLEKFGSYTFIMGIEISHMTRHSNKSNKLRNVLMLPQISTQSRYFNHFPTQNDKMLMLAKISVLTIPIFAMEIDYIKMH